jgi:hypothetical protein
MQNEDAAYQKTKNKFRIVFDKNRPHILYAAILFLVAK